MRCCGNAPWSHDALAVTDDAGFLRFGDCLWGHKATASTIAEWEAGCYHDGDSVLVLRPVGASSEDGERAASYWLAKIEGRSYDWWSVVQIGIKAIFGQLSERIDNSEAKFWCTEGCAESWSIGAGLNPWAPKVNPTPGTTAKRLRQGKFVIIEEAIIDRKFRIEV